MNSIVIASNVIKRILKEINSISFLIVFPILAGILAMAMFGSPKTIEVGVANPPEKNFELVSYIDSKEEYNVTILSKDEIQSKIEKKDIEMGLIFPENYGEDMSNLTTNKIKLVSIEDGENVQTLRGNVEKYMASALGGLDSSIDLEESNGVSSKEQQKTTALGMIMMFIIMFVGNGMALLLEDKKLKTFTRTFAAPLKGYEMALGQLMANTLLGTVQISIFLIFTTLVFKMDWGVPVINVFLILFTFMIAAIGFAIGLAGFIKDNEKYNMILMLLALASSFLGGSFFPLEYLSDFIKKISNFIPQKWALESFTTLSGGGSLEEITINLGILLLFGIVLFTFGVKTLKPNPDDL